MHPTRLAVVVFLVALCAVSGAGAAQVTVGAAENRTIAQIAAANPDLSTLVTALEAADLVETLNGTGPYTVFAPTNDAIRAVFDQLPPGSLDRLLANRTALTAILSYHVAPGSYPSGRLAVTPSLPTLQGTPLSITTLPGGGIQVDYATVTRSDIRASNGVVHVINSLLVPDANTTPTPTTSPTVTTSPTANATMTPTATPTGVSTGVPFVPPEGVASSSEDYTGSGAVAATTTAPVTATATTAAAANGTATATVTATPVANATATTGTPGGNATATPVATTPAGTVTAGTTVPVNTTATQAGIDPLPLAVLSLTGLVLLAARRR